MSTLLFRFKGTNRFFIYFIFTLLIGCDKEALRVYQDFELPNSITYTNSLDIQLELVETKKIWNNAAHNAFTDIVEFNNKYYIVFREGTTHVSRDGIIRLLESDDLENWESIKVFEISNIDLRDPKLSVSPSNDLLVYAGGAFLNEYQNYTHETYMWITSNLSEWSEKITISRKGEWLWRFRWNDTSKNAFGFAYNTGRIWNNEDHKLILYRGEGSYTFSPIYTYTHIFELERKSTVSESDIIFLNGDVLFTVVRRENTALFGFGYAPYTRLHWNETNQKVSSPALFKYNEKILLSGRYYDTKNSTSIFGLDMVSKEIKEILRLPSRGDTGYSGIMVKDQYIYVSYYSDHEGKTSIYLSKIKVLEG